MESGYCGCGKNVKIALVSIHEYEEPCISDKNGSGTIFFSNCNMGCIYCQNYEISHQGKGKEVSIERLTEIMLEQQKRGVNNINLVTPTMYAYQIIEAIKIARENGLNIPIIYNTSGYESKDTIKELSGYIDIYLTDFKYFSNEMALKYGKVNKYFENATESILEMQKQVPENIFEDGILKKGLIIRQLVYPNHIQNSKNILKWIKTNMNENVIVSLMAQYFPAYKAKEETLLNRKLTRKEYKEIEKYFFTLDFRNGYIQDLGEHEEEYVPDFNLRNIEKED